MVVSVTEYTDTACSWAWGSEPKMRRLQWAYGEHLAWRLVMGGLLPDDWPASGKIPAGLDIDHPDAIAFVLRYHAGVCATTGMPYPGTIHWQPENSNDTGRGYIAALAQGEDVAARLLRRCREAQFLFGRPAGNETQLLALAAEVPGLNVARLSADLRGPEVAAAWAADWEETRRPNEAALTVSDGRVGMGRARNEHGRTRYGFPTLIFRGPGGEVTVPGWRPWEAYEQALATAAGGALPAARPLPSPAEALAHHGLLARPELDLLCGPDPALPAGAVYLDLGGGPFWLSPDEARGRQIGAAAP